MRPLQRILSSVQSSVGWLTIVSFLAAGALGSLVLLVVVERAKKCLDHAVTCFIVHLLLSSASFGFPLRADWWMLHVVLVAVMAVLGEWLCIQKEMREIPLGSLGQQLRQQRYARQYPVCTLHSASSETDSRDVLVVVHLRTRDNCCAWRVHGDNHTSSSACVEDAFDQTRPKLILLVLTDRPRLLRYEF